MVLLRSWLSLDIQQRLVNESQSAAHLFKRPTTASGGKYHLWQVFCDDPKKFCRISVILHENGSKFIDSSRVVFWIVFSCMVILGVCESKLMKRDNYCVDGFQMAFGCSWDSKTRRYAAPERGLRFPVWMYDLGRELAFDAQKHTPVYAQGSNFEPDVALVNFYPVSCYPFNFDH